MSLKASAHLSRFVTSRFVNSRSTHPHTCHESWIHDLRKRHPGVGRDRRTQRVSFANPSTARPIQGYRTTIALLAINIRVLRLPTACRSPGCVPRLCSYPAHYVITYHCCLGSSCCVTIREFTKYAFAHLSRIVTSRFVTSRNAHPHTCHFS